MRRIAFIATLCAAVLLAAGCGDKESVVKTATTEGTTVDVGDLKYQVQISRYLNPNDPEDEYYLRGLPATTPLDLGQDAVWFAVFMRVKNESEATRTPTTQFTITDTENNKFMPVGIDDKVNPFAYVPTPIPHAGVLPEPESPSANGPIQGSLILFRIDSADLQNRPLVLHIDGPRGDTATVELDL
jgi:hypothetical protein